MNQKLNYPVATMLMAAVAQAQAEAPPHWRPWIMIGVLLVGYTLHIFNGHDSDRQGPDLAKTK